MIGREVEFLRLSARQLRSKRLRVVLTVIGIAIGVAAIIGVVALGEGIRYQAIETVKTQSDLTLIEVHPQTDQEVTQLITQARVDHLRSIPHVTAAAPVFSDSYATKKQTFLQILAVRADEIDEVLRLKYTSGGVFSPRANEVVVGADLGTMLQRNEGIRMGDPFIAMVREYDEQGMPSDKEVSLAIVGTLGGRDDKFDRMMLIDMESAAAIRGSGQGYDTVFVRVDDPDRVFSVVDRITSQGLEASGAFEQIRAVNQFMDAVMIVFMIFAAFALVVGGMMITTTMTTSVYERTREIGITMAIGASENDVIRLVLYECLLIGVIGGALGGVFGALFTSVMNVAGRPFIIAQLGPEFSSIFGSEIARLSPGLLLAGLGIAVVFSLVAGIYPARKATRMNPVEAIRGFT
ncbi:MAG: ABC transporter permease [Methanomicrobiales archaeon]|nr:ABC transporter permease [Methanomicrobiales archaeon]